MIAFCLTQSLTTVATTKVFFRENGHLLEVHLRGYVFNMLTVNCENLADGQVVTIKSEMLLTTTSPSRACAVAKKRLTLNLVFVYRCLYCLIEECSCIGLWDIRYQWNEPMYSQASVKTKLERESSFCCRQAAAQRIFCKKTTRRTDVEPSTPESQVQCKCQPSRRHLAR